MNLSQIIGSILKAERTKRGFSVNETANTFIEWGIDCSRTTLGRIENGAIASFPIIDGYCKLFGWKYSELDKRIRGNEEVEPKEPVPIKRKPLQPHLGRELPVLSWVQAGNWSESPHLLEHEQETKFVTGKSPKNSFLLKVNGTSMENCDGKDHFPNGSYIVVNPDLAGTIDDYVGKFVIAVDEATQESTFKQLVEDGGSKFLKPLNLQYPVMKVTATTHIKGVVFRVIDDRRV